MSVALRRMGATQTDVVLDRRPSCGRDKAHYPFLAFIYHRRPQRGAVRIYLCAPHQTFIVAFTVDASLAAVGCDHGQKHLISVQLSRYFLCGFGKNICGVLGRRAAEASICSEANQFGSGNLVLRLHKTRDTTKGSSITYGTSTSTAPRHG